MRNRTRVTPVATGTRYCKTEATCRIENCHDDSLPDLRFPLCGRHAAAIVSDIGSAISLMPRGVSREDVAGAIERTLSQAAPPVAKDAVVYYVRLGDLVKIGTTIRIKERMSAFRNTCADPVLLAAEHGDYRLEHARHAQFAEYRVVRELFRPGPDLKAHIDTLRAHRLAA